MRTLSSHPAHASAHQAAAAAQPAADLPVNRTICLNADIQISTTASGELVVSDRNVGITHVSPDDRSLAARMLFSMASSLLAKHSGTTPAQRHVSGVFPQ